MKNDYGKSYYEKNKELIKARRRERYLRDQTGDETPNPFSVEQEPEQAPPEGKASAPGFWTGVKKAISEIDGEMVTKALPKTLLFLAIGVAVFYLFWLQSTELYASAGFSNPGLIALGGILMISLFAAFHAVSRSTIAILLCLYAFGYEGYFMVTGTLNDETVVAIEGDPELQFLKEKAERTRGEYLGVKARYEDPESRVYRNGWYKKKFLTPAWERNEAAQREFIGRRTEIEARSGIDHVAMLKIFYRLGMVLMVMLVVHGVVGGSIGLLRLSLQGARPGKPITPRY